MCNSYSEESQYSQLNQVSEGLFRVHRYFTSKIQEDFLWDGPDLGSICRSREEVVPKRSSREGCGTEHFVISADNCLHP